MTIGLGTLEGVMLTPFDILPRPVALDRSDTAASSGLSPYLSQVVTSQRYLQHRAG